jgi:hypothetical protein
LQRGQLPDFMADFPSIFNRKGRFLAGLDSIDNELVTLGLNPDTIRKHQQALVRLMSGKVRKFLPVIDTCRPGNGGILNLSQSVESLHGVGGSGLRAPFAAFIPAAGAASRYIRLLADLELAAESGDKATAAAAVEALKTQGARNWPLPPLLSQLVGNPDLCRTLTTADFEKLRTETTMPKALMPCVAEGDSFLSVKLREHRSLIQVGEEVYIAPPGQGEHFDSEIRTLSQNLAPMPVRVLEQHGGLSTVRFHPDGRPFLDKSGKPSVVPAGHGTLTELFPACAGKVHSLFIRNIDNVMGNTPDVVATTSAFLTLHDKILTLLGAVRKALAASDAAAAAVAARPLLTLGKAELTPPSDDPLATLAHLQRNFFHSEVSEKPSLTELRQLFERPLNILGQVPNTGKDIGGTPCFVTYRDKSVKICLEVPHASPEDKQNFLANPEKATHFNPVFAAAEIVADKDYYQKKNEDFWLMAEKSYQGAPVIYYETVLYELIGNSSLANTLFVEVPRIVFNPHKTLSDASSNSVSRWLPNP